METRIVFSILQLCLICLSLDSRWFFEPDLDYSDDSQLIAAHARLLQSVLKVPLGTRDVAKIPSKDVELEREGKSNGVETETQRFARQSFNLIPFQNLAKNLKFQSPSSTFCKNPEDILKHPDSVSVFQSWTEMTTPRSSWDPPTASRWRRLRASARPSTPR